MFELNVTQCGVDRRVVDVFHRRMRNDRITKKVQEKYLRNDISCGLVSCQNCSKNPVACLNIRTSSDNSLDHAIILDPSALIRFHHLFENPEFINIIIMQTVWEDMKKSCPPAYKTIYSLFCKSQDRKLYVFMDDFHRETHLDVIEGESEEDRLIQSLVTCAKYYENHWKDLSITPFLVCGSAELKDQLKPQFDNVLTLQEYVEGMEGNEHLLDKITVYNMEADSRNRILFPEHLSPEEIQDGIESGKFKRAMFHVSHENYTEAFVQVDEGTTWFIEGYINMNRAVNGDIVAVELLPESEWTCPQKIIRLRDVEEIQMDEAVDKEDDQTNEASEKKSSMGDKIPSARIVGIIKRNWRQYCGMILTPNVKDSSSMLFAAAERLIPRIRIETRQADRLLGKRVIVAIDSWPSDSRYPVGHYVRSIGTAGDQETENEVLLLEHDIPHGPFSQAVYECLPVLPWSLPYDSCRRDLRSLIVCSVDPPGCTDIDDAVHFRRIAKNRYEVGVHIADVSYFVRPNTAVDTEAAYRGTTVYLCNKRIDMLPGLLSSNLCSLQANVNRLAFSVIWILSKDADIMNVRFQKSIIRSSAALTYEQAQNRIDDTSLAMKLKVSDPLTLGLRGLLKLSKKLKAKRRAKGALNLASSEISFNMDSATKSPIGVLEKTVLPTNSMIEEFMLLANISVAERISVDYPDCALLRRHPIPTEENYKQVVDMAKAKGFQINIESGKALAESLDKAVDPDNPVLNILLRMLATRCMTQALYFSAGSIPAEQYIHFGLATPIYTHFTSPIRRYADIMVHRLLAASINADSTCPEMLNSNLVNKIASNLNYRHKQAQRASRASISFTTLLYFKDRTELVDAFVMSIRKNGIQVLVPNYGLESVVVFPKDLKYEVTDNSLIAEGIEIQCFQRIKVKLSLNESDIQHIRLDIKLVSPKVPGFSVDYNICAPEE
ncbi:unnamed protein product [Thelazia callipaeda]|uniref:Protein DIS3 homolog n=1 Tax=Thelazia callipaeda TaxID=103827 RepID=A0A0N5CZU5_THECL|nr:unnamed protein product [Thelazia callipaeda]